MLYGLLVMRNEADRYLEACLKHNAPLFDKLFVYDDQSDDNSVQIAERFAHVVVRPDDVPSFIEHEGKFREAAWREFETAFNPTEDDWVLSFDADEFIVAREGDPNNFRAQIDRAAGYAAEIEAESVIIPIPEVFDVSNRVQIRTDGFWGKIQGRRLFRYRQTATWRDKAMGCGSDPEYVARHPESRRNFGVHILHFGYACFEDRTSKYDRYSSLADHGHNSKHIESILAQPSLLPWTGPTPDLNNV